MYILSSRCMLQHHQIAGIPLEPTLPPYDGNIRMEPQGNLVKCIFKHFENAGYGKNVYGLGYPQPSV